jgi:hypothetical protein
MPLMRRGGRPGLIGTAARTAVIAGTAGAVRDRQMQRAHERQAAQEQAAAPPPAPAPAAAPAETGGDDLVAKLGQLTKLHEAGALTADEFAAAKAQLLG